MSSLAIPAEEIEQMKGLATLMPGEAPELFAKMIFGRGLGMSAAQSLSQIDFVKGKCELSANAQASRMRAYVGPWGERYDYEVAELSNERCVLRFWRRWEGRDDEHLGDSAFSMDDARQAGIANGMYSKYARNMLLSRAMSNGVAWFAPETTYGIRVYSPGELDPKRDHPVPELPAGADQGMEPETATTAKQLDAAPADLPTPATAPAEPVTARQDEQTPAAEPLVAVPDAPGDGAPTKEAFAELRRRCDEKNLSDATISAIADDVHVPSGDSLRDRFKRATHAQIVNMIGNVEFVDAEPPAGQQTIDGAADDTPAAGPLEGVAA